MYNPEWHMFPHSIEDLANCDLDYLKIIHLVSVNYHTWFLYISILSLMGFAN